MAVAATFFIEGVAKHTAWFFSIEGKFNRRKTKKNRSYFNVETIIDLVFKLIKC